MVIVLDHASQLVYQNIMHYIVNLSKLELNWSSKLRMNNGRKNALVAQVVCFQMPDFETSKYNSEVSKSNSNILVRNYFFPENYLTSEGAVSQNVLYYQQLSVARYKVSFYANNYFE